MMRHLKGVLVALSTFVLGVIINSYWIKPRNTVVVPQKTTNQASASEEMENVIEIVFRDLMQRYDPHTTYFLSFAEADPSDAFMRRFKGSVVSIKRLSQAIRSGREVIDAATGEVAVHLQAGIYYPVNDNEVLVRATWEFSEESGKKLKWNVRPSEYRLEKRNGEWVITAYKIIPPIGQSISQPSLELTQRNPDGWFTFSVPKFIRKVERYADVDGGFYTSDILKIDYSYWTYQNTPNWLRGKYARSIILACSAKNSRSLRTRIDGIKGVIQECSETDETKGFRYIYYVTFPKINVFDGEQSHYGVFNFKVRYRHPRYSSVARQIVRSLNFEQ